MQLTVRDLRDLANRNSSGRRPDLRLAIAEGGDDRGRHYLRSDDLSVANLTSVSATLHDQDLDGRTLCSPRAVIQVEEIAARTLIEDGRATESEGAVSTCRETGSENSTSLGRLIKLELVVCGDVAGSGLSILEDSVLEGSDQNTVGSTVTALLFETVSHITWPRWLPLPSRAYAVTQQGKQARGKQQTGLWDSSESNRAARQPTMRKGGKILVKQTGAEPQCWDRCLGQVAHELPWVSSK